MSSNKILVTYASRNGSTRSIAEAIGTTLSDYGIPVDMRAMQDVKAVSAYRAVIAGSAIQDGGWLPEAMQFVRHYQVALRQKPFAAFLVCMTLALENPPLEVVKAWMEPIRYLVKPISEGYFAGSLDIGKVPSLQKRMAFRFGIVRGTWAEGDHRNWNSIRTWAVNLRAKLS